MIQPTHNQVNARVHEALGLPICIESGVVYDFRNDKMYELPDYCNDYSLRCPMRQKIVACERSAEFSSAMREVCQERCSVNHLSRTLSVAFANPAWICVAFLMAMGQWPDDWSIYHVREKAFEET